MSRSRPPTKTYAAPAIEKAFQIIDLLAEYPQGALVKDMAAHLGRSVGELFRMVVVLEQNGYLNRSPITDRYTVSYKILELAFRATPARNLVRTATPWMRRLVEEVEQSCHLVVPNGAHGLVVAREENPGTRGFALRQGAPIDMIRSCSGQVILAFSPPDVSDRLVREAEAVREEPVDRDWLAGRLETIRARGFDQRKSPITFGVTDISYPIHAFDRELIGALTVPFMELIDGSQRIKLDAVAERLHATARAISSELGCPKD
ncbi:IclR family transcriptional regulator [Stakelama pacifica]|uniref:IclR family transcriptional regulator n=1 Tax=Stakelama pacifica TaxID=517720 RepID=A0A4R6FSB0_9SPHN|nr:IclR family transcriptional regulator [Stakelama pacifica]TDN84676.1 IclR family transcriptional regulator [Stakelama pacifica]GGO93103.1 IclR family transcriptional regulator [Stakelama pacifica]